MWVIFALLDPDPDSESGSTDLIESGSNPEKKELGKPDRKKYYKLLNFRFLDRRAQARDMNGAKTLGRVGGVSGAATAAGAITAATLKDDKEEKVPDFFPQRIYLYLCLI